VLVDNDKDTDMIPGWHYNPRKKEKYHIGYKEAKYNFYKQLLIGDTADNIAGCEQEKGGRKFGPATAQVFILGERVKDPALEADIVERLDFIEVEKKIADHYLEIYGEEGEQKMVERGNLLWMPQPNMEVYIPMVCGDDYNHLRLPIKESLDVLL